jgi:hypothetical protein
MRIMYADNRALVKLNNNYFKTLLGGGLFTDEKAASGVLLAALILIAIGIAGIIRGILLRKSTLDTDKGQ